MSSIEEEIQKQFDHQLTKKNLREKNQQTLTISENGGLFKISPELFAMLTMFDEDNIILEDSFGNPILIKNRQDFLYKCKTKYHEVMNNWHVEYEQLKRIRKPEQL